MRRHALLAIGVAALLALAGCSGGSVPAAQPNSTPDPGGTIQVAGSGSADAEPNRAVVRVSVVETAADAATARRRLARNTSRMRDALAAAGVDEDRIRTTRYDIYRDRRRPREEGEEPAVQYRASHDFEITVTEPDRIGRIIDTAVGNGATGIDDVSFTLSTNRRRVLERQARSAAMADAREKARTLAADANLTVTGVRVIRTGRSGSPRPAGGDGGMTATAAPTPAPGSSLESGPVTVTASVQVVYETAPADESTG